MVGAAASLCAGTAASSPVTSEAACGAKPQALPTRNHVIAKTLAFNGSIVSGLPDRLCLDLEHVGIRHRFERDLSRAQLDLVAVPVVRVLDEQLAPTVERE